MILIAEKLMCTINCLYYYYNFNDPIFIFTKIQIPIFNPKIDISFLCKNPQKRVMYPNDPQRRWILWVLSTTEYFVY